MRSGFKTFALFGVALSIIGFMDLTPVQFGKFSSVFAEASEWSEGILTAVNGLPDKEGQIRAIGPIEIRLADGNSFRMDPKAKIKDTTGLPISLEQFIAPSKIRLLLDKGIVRELVLIEVLPR